jgi:ATP synthase protein I
VTSPPKRPSPTELERQFDREVRRYRERETGHRSFWQSLGVLGSVGWPIALLSVGGGLLGRWLDVRFQTGVRLTLTLLFLGATLGAVIAWNAIQRTRR